MESNSIAIMEKSMQDIKAWMEAVKLKLNEARTEFIFFWSRQQLNKTTHTAINVIGELIKRSTKVWYLAGHLASNLTFKDHMHIKCKAATLNIIRICNIRKYLTRETCQKLILQLVISHLDYANSMLAGLPSSSIKLMQRVQNKATRLILRKNAMESTTQCLKTLHWLLIQWQIDYRICTLIYKCCSKQAPVYLQNLIQEKTTHPSLTSENKKALLAVPNIRKQTFATRSFSVYGPKLWNSLPTTIREEVGFEKFKNKLRTCLFTTAYM